MLETLSHIGVVAILFVVLDALWLGAIANKFYKTQLGSLLRDKPAMLPAVAFYVLYVIGMVVFALEPALRGDSAVRATMSAGFLGLLMYATYDLTNQATLKRWPAVVTIVDLAWGTVATAATVTIAFLIFS